jgi:hypothetical protein
MCSQLRPLDADLKLCAAKTLFYGGQFFLCGAESDFPVTIYIFKFFKNTTPAALFGGL